MTWGDRLADLGARAWRRMPPALRRFLLIASNHRMMVGAIALIPDRSGRVLLLEHRFRPPFAWGLPGGFLRANESPVEGLRRELLEETGLEVELDPQIFDVEYNLRGGYVALTLLAQPIDHAPPFLSREIVGAARFSPGQLPAETYPHHAWVVSRWASLAPPGPGR